MNRKIKQFFCFMREQIHRSTVTNTNTITNLTTSVLNKDALGAGKAITAAIKNAIKEVTEEITAATNELVADFRNEQDCYPDVDGKE